MIGAPDANSNQDFCKIRCLERISTGLPPEHHSRARIIVG